MSAAQVFDLTVDPEDTSKGYAAMDDRTALKVLVTPGGGAAGRSADTRARSAG